MKLSMQGLMAATGPMRTTYLLRGLLLIVLASSAVLRADTILMNSGETLDGVIVRIDAGNVTLDQNGTSRQVALSDVQEIDFNTPHLTEGTPSQPLEHFTETMQEDEIVRLLKQLEDSRYELQNILGQIEGRWLNRPTVRPEEVPQWEAEKERFQAPLLDYQETLRELYLHLLAHVDDYNLMAEEAHDLYVGVEGIFRIGSPLVPDDQTELPLRRFLPGHLVDQIYYEGYKEGADRTRQLMELGEQSPNRTLGQPRQDDQEN